MYCTPQHCFLRLERSPPTAVTGKMSLHSCVRATLFDIINVGSRACTRLCHIVGDERGRQGGSEKP